MMANIATTPKLANIPSIEKINESTPNTFVSFCFDSGFSFFS